MDFFKKLGITDEMAMSGVKKMLKSRKLHGIYSYLDENGELKFEYAEKKSKLITEEEAKLQEQKISDLRIQVLRGGVK